MKQLLIIVLGLILVSGCDQTTSQKAYQQQILALGTLVDISLYGVDEATTHQAVNKVREQLEYIHHDWHAWEPSTLTKINERLAAGETVTLTPEGQKLIEAGIQLSRTSGGLFDPGAGQLINLWGFQSDERLHAPPPTEEQIAQVLEQKASMTQLKLEGNQLSSPNPAIKLDLGGYAKGYAVDLAIDALKEMGIENAIVNAGGDLRAIGKKGDRAWRIGIRDPRGPGVIAALNTQGDEAVFTSGDYERYFDYDGKRYHHIIDPRIGRPAQGSTSVTIIHNDATTADAAATALFIAGPKEWPAVAKQMGVDQVMLIDEAGTVYMTPAMAKRNYFLVDPPPKTVIVELP